MTPQEELIQAMNAGQQPEQPVVEEATAQMPQQEVAETQDVAPAESAAPPQPPSWEELSSGRVKSAEEFDKLYELASKLSDAPDDAIKVAQMWMSGEGIGDLLQIHNTNYDKMDPESLFYKEWEAQNIDLVSDEDITPLELREEFEKYLESKYPGYDADAENYNLGKVGAKLFAKDAESIKQKFNEAKKSALQLKLEKKPEVSNKQETNESFLSPEQTSKNVKEAEDFKVFDMGDFEGEKVTIPVPDEWRSVATEMAKDPAMAYEGQYFEQSGDQEVFNNTKFLKDMFVVNHLDKIAKYFYDLGKGVTAEEQAVALGQKAPKPVVENPEAGGDMEALIAQMEAQRR